MTQGSPLVSPGFCGLSWCHPIGASAGAWRPGSSDGQRKSRRALHRRLLLATAGSISGAIANLALSLHLRG